MDLRRDAHPLEEFEEVFPEPLKRDMSILSLNTVPVRVLVTRKFLPFDWSYYIRRAFFDWLDQVPHPAAPTGRRRS